MLYSVVIVVRSLFIFNLYLILKLNHEALT